MQNGDECSVSAAESAECVDANFAHAQEEEEEAVPVCAEAEEEPDAETMKNQKPLLPATPKRIAVLMGGWSVEREISISTGVGVASALRSLGHDVVTIDPSPNLEDFIEQLKTCFQRQDDAGVDNEDNVALAATGEVNGPPRYLELVFNALHGPWGESGQCQAILETLRLPFTHSNSLASAVAMNKRMTRALANALGIKVPVGKVMSVAAYLQESFPIYPHVLKPIDSGSSFGVTFVRTADEAQLAAQNWDYNFGTEVLVEEYIPGKELSVAVFGGQATGVLEIRFDQEHHEIFDVTSKYIKGESQTIVPAPIHPEIYTAAMQWSEIMYAELQCTGIVRTDFRYNDVDGEPGQLYLLELNTQPGLTPTSLTPCIMRELFGWTYNDIIQWIVNDALERNNNYQP